MAHFLRGCQGINNTTPRTLQEALTEGPDKLAVIEAEFLWPEAHSVEGDVPVEGSSMYNTLYGSYNYKI